MKNLLLLGFLLSCSQQVFGKFAPDDCVVNVRYTLQYQSSSGGNCTYLFTPTVTVNQSGSSVKLARYTFTVGATTVTVCYSGSPVAIVNCNGPFTALPAGANQVFPTATVVLPCTNNGTIVLTGSTSTQGTSTCTTQTILTGPLPVKLLSFSGTSKTNSILLHWATEWESQNEGFDVQKSTNAKSFEGVGFVKGHATASELSTYEFVDQDVQADQTYYYRLKQRDVSGAIDYSKIIAVRHMPGQEVTASVFPNANTGGSFMVSMKEAQSATIRLYNEAGVEIPVTITKTGDPDLISIAAQNTLAKGIYLLQLVKPDNTVQKSLKVLVQ